MTNDCKTCPVSTGTHKPAEALHQQIDEPQAEAMRLADECEESAIHWVHETDTRFKAAKMLRAQHARIAELEADLEAVGAGGVEPLRKCNKLHQIAEPAQDARTAFEAISRFMKCEWNLDWDPAGFYDDAKTDAAFTWFEQGYMRAQQAAAPQAVQAAVPDGWKLVAVNPEFDNLMYWLDRCHENGHLEQCSDLIEPWLVFDYDSKTNFATHPTKQGLDADMFWDAYEPESCQTSINNVVVEVDSYLGLKIGDTVTIQRALKLPDLEVRITMVPDSEGNGDLEWEELAAQAKQGGAA